MELFFNASTSAIGGAIQLAANFISASLKDDTSNINWNFAISEQVARNLRDSGIACDHCSLFHVFNESPARSREAGDRLRQLVTSQQPDLVFTMSGPAYVDFPVTHVQGCFAPYVTHARIENYFADGMIKGGRKLAESIAKMYFFHRCEYLLFETESSRQGFLRRGRFDASRTSVIPNGIGQAFIDAFPDMRRNARLGLCAKSKTEILNILFPSAYYSHKNFGIVVPTAKALREHIGTSFRFVLTLPFGDEWNRIEIEAQKAGLSEQVVNNGPYVINEAPDLYENSSAIFFPSRLETFSASYLEAMWCGLPIVTSDLSFAREICDDAALFVDTRDPQACADALSRVLTDMSVARSITKSGFERVTRFPNSKEKYEMTLKFLSKVISERQGNERG